MSNREREMNEKDLKQKLIDERLHDAANLSEEERRLLEGDRRLQAELQLNLVIDANRPEPPEAPDVAGQIDRVLRRTAELNVSAAPPALGRRWQFAFAAAAVVLLVALAALPWRVACTDGTWSLVRRDAWASVEGHVLLYFLESRDYYGAMSVDSPDHPAWRLQVVTGDWSTAEARERHLASPAEVAAVEVGPQVAVGDGSVYRQLVRVNIYLPGADLPGELAGLICADTGLADPEVRAETWFSNDRAYPGRFFPGWTLVVNGRVYAYPREVCEPDNPLLTGLLDQCWGGTGGGAYLALAGDGGLAGLDLAGISRMECRGGDVVSFEQAGTTEELSGLDLPESGESLILRVSPGDEVTPEEAISQLQALAEAIAAGELKVDAGGLVVALAAGGTSVGPGTGAATGPVKLGLAYYFYPPERFEGLHQSNVRSAFSAAEFAAGLDAAEGILAVLDSYKAGRGISLHNRDALPGLQELVYNGLVAGAVVRTDYTDEAQLGELRDALAPLGLPEPVILRRPLGAIGNWGAGEPGPQPVQRLAGLNPVLVFHLSYEERCQVCSDADLPRVFTDAERRGSRRMLKLIKEQVREWLATQEPGTGAGVLETIAGDTVVRITVQCNRFDDATVAGLAQALQVSDPPTSYYLERAEQAAEAAAFNQGGIRRD